MDRAEPLFVYERLRQAGARPRKVLGQHFLVDSSVLEIILQAANLQSGEEVLEIGPGSGVLTERLLMAGAQVTAVEFDSRMAGIIREDFPDVRLIEGDALQVIPKLNLIEKGTYKVVANIPYQITTPLLRLFLEGIVSPPTELILLMQKEVGQRLAAPAGGSGRGYLSVLCQYFAEVEYLLTVPRSSFLPPPEVDSAVVRLRLRRQRPLQPEQEAAFFKLVHLLFIQPRKQLKNVLAGIRGVSSQEVSAYFKRIGFPETARAQELTTEQWLTLYNQPFP